MPSVHLRRIIYRRVPRVFDLPPVARRTIAYPIHNLGVLRRNNFPRSDLIRPIL